MISTEVEINLLETDMKLKLALRDTYKKLQTSTISKGEKVKELTKHSKKLHTELHFSSELARSKIKKISEKIKSIEAPQNETSKEKRKELLNRLSTLSHFYKSRLTA